MLSCLLKYIVDGKVELTKIITHVVPLDQVPLAYQLFDEKKNECIN